MFTVVFPGQGSQQPGMGKYFFENFKAARQVFEEASDAIKLDIKKLCFEGSDTELALTENTQPALVTVSTAVFKVLESEFGLKPVATAGHSVGEYASLVASKVISLSDAIKAVRLRGQAMQSAVPVGKGGMLAVLGLEDKQVAELCTWVLTESMEGPISPANFNSPGQVVISGSQKAIDWLKQNFKPEVISGNPKRAKLIPLQVSAPFHCQMMMPAEEKMKTFLSDIKFSNAQFPIIQNYNASPEIDAEKIKFNIIKQISAPVLWTQSVEKMKSLGFKEFIECGHGKVLAGLIKKIDAENLSVFSTQTQEDIKIIEDKIKASSH